jgi:ribonuclease HII
LIFVSSSVLIGANPWLDVVVVRLRKPDSEISRSAAKLRLLKRLKCTLKYEKLAWATGAQLVCGVDEVGRGAFFGPVVAGAVILDPKYRIKGLRDSKLLPAARREVLSERIKEHCIAWSVAAVDAARIDQINIYQASLLAMVQAIEQLDPRPDYLLLDAVRVQFDCPQTKIIHGDALSASIAAASIVAKVHRDALITQWAPVFPEYDLASNKGYRSPKHIASLRKLGPTPLHRQSFAPVWLAAHPQEVLEFMLSENPEEEPSVARQEKYLFEGVKDL